jgi:hypothetical protein
MTRAEFRDLVAIADRLMVNLADFNALHFVLQVFGVSRVPESSPGLKRRWRGMQAPWAKQ